MSAGTNDKDILSYLMLVDACGQVSSCFSFVVSALHILSMDETISFGIRVVFVRGCSTTGRKDLAGSAPSVLVTKYEIFGAAFEYMGSD